MAGTITCFKSQLMNDIAALENIDNLRRGKDINDANDKSDTTDESVKISS
jgi:hypothetical protein